jgi:hypothetical protein
MTTPFLCLYPAAYFAQRRHEAVANGWPLLADFYAEALADIEVTGLLKQAGF